MFIAKLAVAARKLLWRSRGAEQHGHWPEDGCRIAMFSFVSSWFQVQLRVQLQVKVLTVHDACIWRPRRDIACLVIYAKN